LKEPHPLLLKYLPLLVEKRETPLRFLVPCSGKSLDLKYLWESGHEVVGIEFVEEAIVDFFRENGIPYKREDSENGRIYSTNDGKLQVLNSNLFTANLSGTFGGNHGLRLGSRGFRFHM
jgi:thiopurine S-methyltransferase